MSRQPATPPTIDPTIAINAQKNANIQSANSTAALNHTNQSTPWGNLTWANTKGQSHFDQSGYDSAIAKNANASRDTFTSYDPDTWSSSITLSPDQQSLMDQQNRDSLALGRTGEGLLGQVNSNISTPLNFSGLTSVQQGNLQNSAGSAGNFQNGFQGGNLQNGVQSNNFQNNVQSGNLQKNIADSGGIQSGINNSGGGGFVNYASYGNIQDKLDTSGVPSLVGGSQLSGAMQDAQNASYNQAQSRLNPQWQNDQHDLENRLTQQGIMQNSDAWNRATESFGRNKNDAYQTARNNSVGEGNAAQAQLYGQGLSSNQNAYSQVLNTANFANNAQAQGFGQNMQNAQLNNSVVNSKFAQAQAMQQAQNSAQNQLFNQNYQKANFNNASEGQQFNQGMQNADLFNQGQANQFNQGIQNASLNNQAQAQQFGQGMQNAGMYNANAQQQYNNQLSNASLNNQAQNQQFNQSMSARNQGLNELMTQRSNPLNELNALRSGSQVTNPQFNPGGNIQVGNTDAISPINSAYNQQMGLYNSQVGGNNANMGALGQLGAAGIGAAGLFF